MFAAGTVALLFALKPRNYKRGQGKREKVESESKRFFGGTCSDCTFHHTVEPNKTTVRYNNMNSILRCSPLLEYSADWLRYFPRL